MVTTHPYQKKAQGWSVEEVSLAGMPKPSLQGRIYRRLPEQTTLGTPNSDITET